MSGEYKRVVVHVPLNMTKQFKTAIDELGCEIEKRNAIQRAFDDIEAGRVHEVSSVDELRKIFA